MGRAMRTARHAVALTLGLAAVLVALTNCGSSPVPAVSATATRPATVTAATPCQAINLTLGIEDEQSGDGNRAYIFQLVNGAKDACTLDGYPGVQLLDTHLHPVSIPVKQQTDAYFYTNAQPRLVTLASAATAYFVVDWFGSEYGSGTCPSAGYIQVMLPGVQAPGAEVLFFPAPITTCAGGAAVSPIEPTLTALGY